MFVTQHPSGTLWRLGFWCKESQNNPFENRKFAAEKYLGAFIPLNLMGIINALICFSNRVSLLEKGQWVRMSVVSHCLGNIIPYYNPKCTLQFSEICRHILRPDYTETYYSPRGEEITTDPQNMVGSECFLGFFLGSGTYVARCIVVRTIKKEIKGLGKKVLVSDQWDNRWEDEKKNHSHLFF